MNFTVGVDTIEQCKELLRKKTKPYDLPTFNVVPYKQYTEGLLLRLKGNRVLLYCSNPKWVTVPNEAFYGRIITKGGKVLVCGRMGPTYQTCFRFAFYLFGILFLVGREAWFMGVLFLIIVLIFFGVDLQREPYPANRQAIIDLLNSLELGE